MIELKPSSSAAADAYSSALQTESAALQEKNSTQGLEESIGRIDALIGKGKKICLFIGRTPAEKLPSETGEAKPDEVWVSCDGSDQGPAIAPGRIHLKMNCNDQESIMKLQKRFDLIVVDTSVIKFFQNDFANRFSVMIRSPESRMIFEASTGMSAMCFDLEALVFNQDNYSIFVPWSFVEETNQRKDECLEHFRATVPGSEQEAVWDEFMQKEGNSFVDFFEEDMLQSELEKQFRHFLAEKSGVLENGGAWEFGRQQLDAHLKTIFEHVELKDQPYPYLNNYSQPHENRPHFVVSHPKKI